MKFNVFFKNDLGARWVLSNGSPLFESPLFETRPEAIDDLENFVTLMESPVFIDNDECNNASPVTVTFKQKESRWHWELFISSNGMRSKIAVSPEEGINSLELAKQKATFFCNSIVKAPILDQNDVAIPNMWFEKPFAAAHNIGDIHPSSKWLK
ncbi:MULTISPECIES: hypothetical protein [Citrobacter]|uniref:hypothetical protein n=1 Tax=Citrobacter TaxID=544 RepID=UPI000BAE3E07|nr:MULTISPECIES: hypothetical protein [Citrobacter]PAX80022.1 hypothetical protein CIK43_09115 [Citrobacter sp. TSA-1]POT31354.1 hypothetical protein C3423_10905 [Citrobacter braakii]POT36168.1 hypothetical protein C3431_10900 [Citrobacter braakii]POT40994.1 hypothetical protein C3425_10895 [Citrobacter braakii]POU82536.1 hypothetical protein C3426_10900 [Citrobacter braakii]